MSSDQHGTIERQERRQEPLENQKQSITVEENEDDDPFAEFSFVTGHDVENYSSDQDYAENETNNDTDANTLKLVTTATTASDSSKRRRGAPKMQKQKRVSHQYTELVYSAKSKGDLAKRKLNLDFVLKKTSNNSKLTYFKCVTHKNCNYTELVRKAEAGTGFHAHVFTKINPSL